jgi:SAM-dependent methyltransferase
MPDLDDYGHLPEQYAAMRFQHVRCDNCSTVYLRNPVPQDEIAVFYSGDYHCFRPFSERGWLISTVAKALARRKAAALANLFPAGNDLLLDYGCGSGTWIRELEDCGATWRMIGTDVVPEAITRAKAIGVEAYLADENSITEVTGRSSVGIIHMFHVIEHLPDPVDVLRKLREVLVEGGIVIGQTPNVASWDARLFGRYGRSGTSPGISFCIRPRHFVRMRRRPAMRSYRSRDRRSAWRIGPAAF